MRKENVQKICSQCQYAVYPDGKDSGTQEGECFFNPPFAMLTQAQHPITQQVATVVVSYRARIGKDTMACGHIQLALASVN